MDATPVKPSKPSSSRFERLAAKAKGAGSLWPSRTRTPTPLRVPADDNGAGAAHTETVQHLDPGSAAHAPRPLGRLRLRPLEVFLSAHRDDSRALYCTARVLTADGTSTAHRAGSSRATATKTTRTRSPTRPTDIRVPSSSSHTSRRAGRAGQSTSTSFAATTPTSRKSCETRYSARSRPRNKRNRASPGPCVRVRTLSGSFDA